MTQPRGSSWDLPFDQAIAYLRPGRWDRRVLDQDRVWVDAAGTVHPIGDLTDAHVANILAMLRRYAQRAAEHEPAVTGADAGDGSHDAPAAPRNAVAALGWLEHTALWQALQAEVTRRALAGPDAASHVSDVAGLWAVRTHHSTYVLDLDASRVARLPAPGAPPLPSDRVWVRLDDTGPVHVGAPLHLVLELATGLTTRTTTPVTGLRRIGAGTGDADLFQRGATAWGSDAGGPRLTGYRTAEFVRAATRVCDDWAALQSELERAGVHPPALLVPRRLRDPDARLEGVELCVSGTTPAALGRLQTAVDEILGAHVPVTTATDYPVNPSEHAVVLNPGTAASTDP